MDLAANGPTLPDSLDAALRGVAAGPPLVRGVVRVSGSRRLDFLHRMSTQQLAGLAPGRATYAAFLDGKARVLGEGMVAARDADVLVDVDAAAAPPLVAHLRKYVLREDVKLEPLEGARVVPLVGARAAELARSSGAAAWENTRRGVPAWDLLADDADALRGALADAGATSLAEDDLEVLRVLAGIPRWGAELDDARLVMEAGLIGSAVSFDKGCYLGQEIVLRGTFRGQVQRGLVQLDLPPGAGAGTRLRTAGPEAQEVGVVTSAVDVGGRRVGLGYLRRAQWAPGTRLSVSEPAGAEAVVRRAMVIEKD